MKKKILFVVVCGLSILIGCDSIEKIYPIIPPSGDNKFDEKITDTINYVAKFHTVFNAGDDGVNVFRIPSMVTSKQGSLVVASEARKTTWRDKSPTDIAVKRSTDGGRTWSKIKYVTDGAKNNYAFMDPCLLTDEETGRIYLFVCRWPVYAENAKSNIPFMLTSDDDGETWSQPVDIFDKFVVKGGFIHGFGPGAGIQMQGEKYKGRLIVPTRQMTSDGKSRNRTVYSDNNGETWVVGEECPRTGEYEIAETPKDQLYYNLRMSGKRAVSYSTDGGVSWGGDIIDNDLVTIEKGCQSSVYGSDKVLLYTGVYGRMATGTNDDRVKLMLYRSTNSGLKWGNRKLIYEKASGYSCISQLKDGRIAVVFEAGSEEGFTKLASRPAGWMRLDLFILPADVLTPGHWFKP